VYINRKKTVTIYDIAKLTGVTAATVSNALNNKGLVSSEVKSRILDAARDLEPISLLQKSISYECCPS